MLSIEQHQITAKKVYNYEGDFSHIELWQGNNVLKVSFEYVGQDILTNNSKWENLKKLIESLHPMKETVRSEFENYEADEVSEKVQNKESLR